MVMAWLPPIQNSRIQILPCLLGVITSKWTLPRPAMGFARGGSRQPVPGGLACDSCRSVPGAGSSRRQAIQLHFTQEAAIRPIIKVPENSHRP